MCCTAEGAHSERGPSHDQNSRTVGSLENMQISNESWLASVACGVSTINTFCTLVEEMHSTEQPQMKIYIINDLGECMIFAGFQTNNDAMTNVYKHAHTRSKTHPRKMHVYQPRLIKLGKPGTSLGVLVLFLQESDSCSPSDTGRDYM